MKSGGEVLAKSLAARGVEHIFCVAGESYLPLLDGLLNYPEIKVITCRHESGAAFMAEAYANLTGKHGIALVTRGPGACNASIGIHTAKQSSAPVVLIVGLINTYDEGKEAFQEFDVEGMFVSLSKHSQKIDCIKEIDEVVSNAFSISVSGRFGPVVLGLPEDILFAKTPEISVNSAKPVSVSRQQQISGEDITKLRDLLAGASRPVVIVGGGGWSDEDCAHLEKFSSACNLPVAASFRRQDLFSHSHDNYIGELGTGPNPVLVERIKSADVILALGTRLSEITTQEYSLFQPDQKIIHVYPDADVFGKAYNPALAIETEPSLVAAALAGDPVDGSSWAAWRDAARADYVLWTTIENENLGWNGADMNQIFKFLQKNMPDDAVITTDAGNFSGWCQRYLSYGRPGRLLAPISGAMGYAVPSVIAASITRPDVLSVGFCGDGGFMMSASELATAMHYKARPVIVVCNNHMFGTIRMYQEKHYPERRIATDLTNPDFVKMAKSYGAFAARVRDAGDFPDIWQQAINADTAALIEICMDPRQINTMARV